MEKVSYGFTLNTAIALAAEKHKNQNDKQGQPYFLHLVAVADQLQGNEAKMAGFLHDIVEDTPTTFNELVEMGCPESVIRAIRLVTHTKQHPTQEEYLEDIRRIANSGNQIAIDVKWADLTHNSDRSSIPNPEPSHFVRWEKYRQAKEMLKPVVSKYLLEGQKPEQAQNP
jgi:(p)ppGpp synthase/HD superfamily hydrolase